MFCAEQFLLHPPRCLHTSWFCATGMAAFDPDPGKGLALHRKNCDDQKCLSHVLQVSSSLFQTKKRRVREAESLGPRNTARERF